MAGASRLGFPKAEMKFELVFDVNFKNRVGTYNTFMYEQGRMLGRPT